MYSWSCCLGLWSDQDPQQADYCIQAWPREQGLDIGPDSIKLIEDALADAKTVVWNGPAGVFEFPAFAKVCT